jgi:hypothetical protein
VAAQLVKGERKESYLIDLAAEEGWPKDMLRQKIQTIRDERGRIRRQLDQTTNQLEAGRQVFTKALALLDDPHGMYQAGNETVRSLLNRIFFPRLYIDGQKVTDHELREPFDVLHEACTIYRRHQTDEGRANGHPRTYHRTNGSMALTDELAADMSQTELSAWMDTGQTANSDPSTAPSVDRSTPSCTDDHAITADSCIDRRRAHRHVRIHPRQRKPVRSALGQTAAITDFVGQRAPHVFLTPVPVGLPSVGPIKVLGSLVTSVNPQDSFCESLAA